MKANSLLKVKANKLMVREQLQKESGKAVKMKDLSNVAAKKKGPNERNDLTNVVNIVESKHKATVRLLTNENKELEAIYFQDEVMRRSFKDCPEVLFVDTTYKLLETRMACFFSYY